MAACRGRRLVASVAPAAAIVSDSFAQIAAQLTEQARLIASARAEELRLARSNPAARWRKAALLWPQFTKG